jgi:hypothetical protein
MMLSRPEPDHAGTMKFCCHFAGRQEELSKRFFFVKKKQKTFLNCRLGGFTATGTDERSFFCFFFVHKKEDPSYQQSLA